LSGFRFATPGELPRILELRRMFCEHEGLFAFEGADDAVRQLIADERAGRLLVVESAGRIAGYLALTFGFSLEFGGRDAFVDELFVEPSSRGAGLGTAALVAAESACREAGVSALHLEVDHVNERARALYARSGYVAHARHLMTKRL
jgi:GNAT superfamily N-acetyltransferase